MSLTVSAMSDPAAMNAPKSCFPGNASAAARILSSSFSPRGRFNCHARPTRNGSRILSFRMRYSYSFQRTSCRTWKSSGTSTALLTEISGGRTEFSAAGSLPHGILPSDSNVAKN